MPLWFGSFDTRSPFSFRSGNPLSSMSKPLTADELLPLVKHLTVAERARLITLIGASSEDDGLAYRMVPPKPDEFSSDTDPLAWDADGWENLG